MCDSKSCDVWSTGTVFRAWLIGGQLVTRVCKAIGLKQGRTSPESYKQRQRLIDGMMTAFTVDGFGIIL